MATKRCWQAIGPWIAVRLSLACRRSAEIRSKIAPITDRSSRNFWCYRARVHCVGDLTHANRFSIALNRNDNKVQNGLFERCRISGVNVHFSNLVKKAVFPKIDLAQSSVDHTFVVKQEISHK